MKEITDEFMKQMISKINNYTVVILKATEKIRESGTDKIIWEHGRRNFQLREEGILSIVCPIKDGSGITGVGIFNRNPDEVKEIMDGDPGVRAGIFTYEVHSTRSFPGDKLP
jgi:hypothetical protein